MQGVFERGSRKVQIQSKKYGEFNHTCFINLYLSGGRRSGHGHNSVKIMVKLYPGC